MILDEFLFQALKMGKNFVFGWVFLFFCFFSQNQVEEIFIGVSQKIFIFKFFAFAGLTVEILQKVFGLISSE